jgi:hypothetical protein
MADVTIGGYDISGLSFELVDLPNHRAFMQRRFQDAQTVLRDPRRLISTDPLHRRRSLEIVGNMTAADMATLNTNMDKLFSECDQLSEMTIIFGDRTDRQLYGFLESIERTRRTPGREFGTPSGGPHIRMALTFAILDPLWYGTSVTTVSSIQSTYTDIATGTAPSIRDHKWTITGASGASNPVITVLDEDGSTVRKTFEMTASIGSGVSRVIDHDLGTIVDGSAANKISERKSGTDFPFAFDSRWADFRGSDWPQVKLTSTGAQMTLVVQTRKAYY